MGWWTLGFGGGIAELTGGAVNPCQELYGGDGPADTIDGLLGDHPGVAHEVLVLAIVMGQISDGLEPALAKDLADARRDLIAQWQETWGRDPFPEELEGVIAFCWCGTD